MSEDSDAALRRYLSAWTGTEPAHAGSAPHQGALRAMADRSRDRHATQGLPAAEIIAGWDQPVGAERLQ